VNDRLRAVATSLAAVAMFVLGAGVVPSATASAQSSATGSAGGQEPEQGQLLGANDWDCTSQRHPRPVVLVHGTGRGMQASWGDLSEPQQAPGPLIAALENDGYCVFALNYGFGPQSFLGPTGIPSGRTGWGYTALEAAAHELDAFIEKVREATGAPQVDVVGHSQGGTLTRQYLRFEGGASPSGNKVRTLVMLGPSTHGTDYGGLYPSENAAWFAGESKAGQQQIFGSSFLATLNADRETFPGIDYTVIATTTDRTITPHTRSALNAAPGTSVRNMYVQDACPGLLIGHGRKAFDPSPEANPGLLEHPAPIFLVRQALDPTLQGTVPCSG
jgi:triacylglycerol esterase/lipase EstA (alpha/beta hydrolase family)